MNLFMDFSDLSILDRSHFLHKMSKARNGEQFFFFMDQIQFSVNSTRALSKNQEGDSLVPSNTCIFKKQVPQR